MSAEGGVGRQRMAAALSAIQQPRLDYRPHMHVIRQAMHSSTHQYSCAPHTMCHSIIVIQETDFWCSRRYNRQYTPIHELNIVAVPHIPCHPLCSGWRAAAACVQQRVGAPQAHPAQAHAPHTRTTASDDSLNSKGTFNCTHACAHTHGSHE
jgi:hypothetical protein